MAPSSAIIIPPQQWWGAVKVTALARSSEMPWEAITKSQRPWRSPVSSASKPSAFHSMVSPIFLTTNSATSISKPVSVLPLKKLNGANWPSVAITILPSCRFSSNVRAKAAEVAQSVSAVTVAMAATALNNFMEWILSGPFRWKQSGACGPTGRRRRNAAEGTGKPRIHGTVCHHRTVTIIGLRAFYKPRIRGSFRCQFAAGGPCHAAGDPHPAAGRPRPQTQLLARGSAAPRSSRSQSMNRASGQAIKRRRERRRLERYAPHRVLGGLYCWQERLSPLAPRLARSGALIECCQCNGRTRLVHWGFPAVPCTRAGLKCRKPDAPDARCGGHPVAHWPSSVPARNRRDGMQGPPAPAFCPEDPDAAPACRAGYGDLIVFRYAIRSARCCASAMPENGISVPGSAFCGSAMYASRFFSSQIRWARLIAAP